jgi:hypothetical protein
MKKEISIMQIVALVIGCILLTSCTVLGSSIHLSNTLNMSHVIGTIFIAVAGVITVKLFTGTNS